MRHLKGKVDLQDIQPTYLTLCLAEEGAKVLKIQIVYKFFSRMASGKKIFAVFRSVQPNLKIRHESMLLEPTMSRTLAPDRFDLTVIVLYACILSLG